MKGINKKFWIAFILFGLTGQIAWTVENMYLNVFIYKIFNASALDISLMVSLSALVATLTTWIMGGISDYLGKRKIFMGVGYIFWGISILGFRYILKDAILSSLTLGIQLTILIDCIMTYFGSTANDATFNAWLTDRGDGTNRGSIEGINAILPILSMMLVFGGFMSFDLDLVTSWKTIFTFLGIGVFIVGILGFFFIEEQPQKTELTLKEILFYSLKKEVIQNHKMLYATLIAFTLFATSIQIFMPYLLVYYEETLLLENYVLLFAPATLIAAILTIVISKVYDLQGLKLSSQISIAILMIGYIFMSLFTNTPCVFIGTLLIMTGYMGTLSVFGAEVRNRIPENKAGEFQGIRMICQVLIPGVVGPMIGSMLLSNAKQILNQDGTYSFIPNRLIFIGAFILGILLLFVMKEIFKMMQTEHYDLLSEDAKAFIESKEIPYSDHPHPQFKRDTYMTLNGIWKLEGQDILVPFTPQSFLSSFKGKIKDEMTYERTFSIPDTFTKERVLLHFEAVDQICDTYLNDIYLGHHEGGYLPFTFDITSYLKKENHLVVKFKDSLDLDYPYGKQTNHRGGMWYTPVSGIWQSVWLENVPENYIERIKITPDLDGVDLEVFGNIQGFEVKVMNKTYTFDTLKGRIEIDNPIHWTCENPYLYSMTLTSGKDKVESYFALRTIGYKEINGITRVVLNHQPLFMHGLLDQGYYCDGIYLPATKEEYKRDILRMKELGFNLLRKHIKVEPDYFYYYCDCLGMLVMQDFVNNGTYDFIRDTVIPTYVSKKLDDTKVKFDTKAHQIFIDHSKQLVDYVYNHPSIIAYTIFNEGWGQFHSDKVYEMAKTWDPTRLFDSTSGWFAQTKNEFDSEHVYFKQIDIEVKQKPYLISECGGFTLLEKDHIYSKYNMYGYGLCESKEALTSKIISMYKEMILPAISKGLCGCIYTQVSDVEDEINGLYTYDRQVCKVIKEDMQQLAKDIQTKVEEI